jgi:hypothetical protein
MWNWWEWFKYLKVILRMLFRAKVKLFCFHSFCGTFMFPLIVSNNGTMLVPYLRVTRPAAGWLEFVAAPVPNAENWCENDNSLTYIKKQLLASDWFLRFLFGFQEIQNGTSILGLKHCFKDFIYLIRFSRKYSKSSKSTFVF